MENTNFTPELSEKKDPLDESFAAFLKSKKRYWSNSSPRQTFTAGFLAGQKYTLDNLKVELTAEGGGAGETDRNGTSGT